MSLPVRRPTQFDESFFGLRNNHLAYIAIKTNTHLSVPESSDDPVSDPIVSSGPSFLLTLSVANWNMGNERASRSGEARPQCLDAAYHARVRD